MSSQPQYHDTGDSYRRMTSYSPEQTSRPLGAIQVQLENIRDNETASTAAQPSHHVQLDQTASSNNHEHDPQDQERFDDLTVQDILNIQQENHQEIIQEIRAANAENRSILNEAMGQNMSMNFNQGLQQIMGFFTNWTKQFTQHHLVGKVAALEKQLNLANQQKKQLSSEYKEMRTNYRKACTKLDKALRERDEQRRLADGGTLANSSKATDDAILGKWKILDYNIRALAHSLAKSPPSQCPDRVALARLSWISQSYQDHLQDEDYREVLLQGYLWSMANDTVFDAGTRLWGGSGMADLKTIQDNLIVSARETPQERQEVWQQAARWLAQGSSILNQLWGCEPEGVKALANIETTRLMPFLSAQDVGPDRADKVKDEISVIIECAIELDQMLMCSKALFQIHWKDQHQGHSKCQRFNSSTMDPLCYENELSSESTVKMVISPFLYKAGNADGQNYESSMLLVKAAVVCD